MHPFEKTLGAGPYIFVGAQHLTKTNISEVSNNLHQSFVGGMGQCAHCGHPILSIFQIQIGNGDVFGVGSDCIEKAGLDYTQMDRVKGACNERAVALTKVRNAKKIISAKDYIIDIIATRRDEMDTLPHPFFGKSQTLLNYAEWVLSNVKDPKGAVLVIKRALDSTVIKKPASWTDKNGNPGL